MYYFKICIWVPAQGLAMSLYTRLEGIWSIACPNEQDSDLEVLVPSRLQMTFEIFCVR